EYRKLGRKMLVELESWWEASSPRSRKKKSRLANPPPTPSPKARPAPPHSAPPPASRYSWVVEFKRKSQRAPVRIPASNLSAIAEVFLPANVKSVARNVKKSLTPIIKSKRNAPHAKKRTNRSNTGKRPVVRLLPFTAPREPG